MAIPPTVVIYEGHADEEMSIGRPALLRTISFHFAEASHFLAHLPGIRQVPAVAVLYQWPLKGIIRYGTAVSAL